MVSIAYNPIEVDVQMLPGPFSDAVDQPTFWYNEYIEKKR